jgi:hypothetical protein
MFPWRVVPNDGTRGRGFEFVYIDGGKGPGGMLHLFSRGSFVKVEDYVVILFYFKVLFCKSRGLHCNFVLFSF